MFTVHTTAGSEASTVHLYYSIYLKWVAMYTKAAVRKS